MNAICTSPVRPCRLPPVPVREILNRYRSAGAMRSEDDANGLRPAYRVAHGTVQSCWERAAICRPSKEQRRHWTTEWADPSNTHWPCSMWRKSSKIDLDCEIQDGRLDRRGADLTFEEAFAQPCSVGYLSVHRSGSNTIKLYRWCGGGTETMARTTAPLHRPCIIIQTE